MRHRRMLRALLPPNRQDRSGSRSSFAFRTSRWRSKSWTRRLRFCKKLQTIRRIPTKKSKHCSASGSSTGITLNSFRLASPAYELFAKMANERLREANLPIESPKITALGPVRMVIKYHSLNHSLRY